MIKRISELNKEELANLSIGEIKDIIDYECALTGVKLLEEPVEPQYDKPETDKKIYKIGDFVLDNIEDAQKIHALVTSMKLYRTDTNNYTDYYIEPLTKNDYNYPEIQISDVYLKETYDKIKPELISYQNRMNEYNEKSNEFEDNKVSVDEIKKKLQDRIKWAYEYTSHVKNYTKIFNRYLELSNNDLNIARKFLLNVYPDASNYPEIRNIYENERATE